MALPINDDTRSHSPGQFFVEVGRATCTLQSPSNNARRPYYATLGILPFLLFLLFWSSPWPSTPSLVGVSGGANNILATTSRARLRIFLVGRSTKQPWRNRSSVHNGIWQQLVYQNEPQMPQDQPNPLALLPRTHPLDLLANGWWSSTSRVETVIN